MTIVTGTVMTVTPRMTLLMACPALPMIVSAFHPFTPFASRSSLRGYPLLTAVVLVPPRRLPVPSHTLTLLITYSQVYEGLTPPSFLPSARPRRAPCRPPSPSYARSQRGPAQACVTRVTTVTTLHLVYSTLVPTRIHNHPVLCLPVREPQATTPHSLGPVWATGKGAHWLMLP